eukprot:15484881-Alexandrium_andersonii.AAC.1
MQHHAMTVAAPLAHPRPLATPSRPHRGTVRRHIQISGLIDVVILRRVLRVGKARGLEVDPRSRRSDHRSSPNPRPPIKNHDTDPAAPRPRAPTEAPTHLSLCMEGVNAALCKQPAAPPET